MRLSLRSRPACTQFRPLPAECGAAGRRGLEGLLRPGQGSLTALLRVDSTPRPQEAQAACRVWVGPRPWERSGQRGGCSWPTMRQAPAELSQSSRVTVLNRAHNDPANRPVAQVGRVVYTHGYLLATSGVAQCTSQSQRRDWTPQMHCVSALPHLGRVARSIHLHHLRGHGNGRILFRTGRHLESIHR